MTKLINLENGIKKAVSAVRWICLCVFFASFSLLANKGKDPNRYPTITGTDVEIDYAERSGLGFIKQAFYEIHPVTIKNDNVKLEVDLIENKLSLKEEKFQVVIGIDFSFLKDFEQIKLDLEKLSVKNQNISLNVPSLDIHLSGQKYEFDKINLDSIINDVTKKADLKNNLIKDTTLTVSKFKFGEVKLIDYRQELEEDNSTEEELKELEQIIAEDNKKGVIKYIHQVKFSLKEGSLRLTGKVKTLLNLKVLLTAKVSNDEKNKQIHIKVKKMKVGVVNVRKAVLKYLKGLKITNLRINHRTGEIVYVYK